MIDGLGRREMLGAGLGLVALAGCARSGSAQGGNSKLGKQRSVAFAIGTPGSDFVLELSLGCADAAEMLGWRFSRVLNAQPTPDAHINAIRQAVTARNDVVVTVDWYQAVIDEAAKAKPQGTSFAIVNSLNNPDTAAKLGLPFVGQSPRESGRMLGERIAKALAAKGVAQGAVLVGNPFPGSLNVEERIAGVGEGLRAVPGLSLLSFADGSAGDAAASVALYKAKIGEAGNVVAHAAAAGEMSAVPLLKALDELGGTAAKALVAGTVSSLKVLDFVKRGRMAFALDENLYNQGFMAVLLAWGMLERGMPSTSLTPASSWIDAANVDAAIASYAKRKEAAAAYGLS
ncbi:substrate-binding domain-containing protein [Sphingomonas sp. HITSZ_GF]|uniref:sugar ABC transporter substrate-binding protein n=1 Tax=Sphingomonas sp. HITSZ_GF TaxID=3037247 RepID=UPI00240D220F|nr:substrate-binding domain-containing protein [Sphingomonas sp. HITSZ_GF]MDG2533053.1 substrate-binding domain-containing protein [Sphingomonas sp. HITSZ_GF]